ncbi:MAG TPA: hypothetical protein VGK58_17270 [Lacipirellulaceae bacterium]
MSEDRVGMLSRPAIRQHLFEPVAFVMHAHEKFTNVVPRLQSMAFGPSENRVQHSRTGTGRFAP